MFPEAVIPREFKHFKTILKDVVNHFENKYNKEVVSKTK
jgi:hypothetical protein